MKVKDRFKGIRMWYLRTFVYSFLDVGKDTYLGYGLYIRPGCVRVGSTSFIGSGCFLAAKVDIGNFVMLAGRVAVVGGDHRFDLPGVPMIESGRGVARPVIIEDDVWVGHGVILMHGVRIGFGSIVAAGSVVTKDIPPFSIWGGNPPRFLRKRFQTREEEALHRQAISGAKLLD